MFVISSFRELGDDLIAAIWDRACLLPQTCEYKENRISAAYFSNAPGALTYPGGFASCMTMIEKAPLNATSGAGATGSMPADEPNGRRAPAAERALAEA